nr:hypothetical protein [Tanacetum cinerariifolium]
MQELFRKLFKDVQNIHEELAEYINTPGWNRPAFEDDDEDYDIIFTPDFPIMDSLIIENEHLDTIPKTESDEFIKSSVENLVPIPSESEDFFDIESECDMPDCMILKRPIFQRFPILSSMILPLVMTSQVMRSEFNPILNEDLDSTPKNDNFDTKSYLIESFLNRDESIPPGIDSDDSDFEGDNIFLERLLHDAPIPLSDNLDFSYDVQICLPFFTYPVTSSILFSSGSEDTIFDPDIYHFSSLEPGVSHQSGTFMKSNSYPNHLNESPSRTMFSSSMGVSSI